MRRNEDIHKIELQNTDGMQGSPKMSHIRRRGRSRPVKSLRGKRDSTRLTCGQIASATWHRYFLPEDGRMPIL